MTAALETRAEARRRRCLALLRGVAVTALVLHFLFAHGCHGDEDHELFTSAVQQQIAP
jgi:hypothetical protein